MFPRVNTWCHFERDGYHRSAQRACDKMCLQGCCGARCHQGVCLQERPSSSATLVPSTALGGCACRTASIRLCRRAAITPRQAFLQACIQCWPAAANLAYLLHIMPGSSCLKLTAMIVWRTYLPCLRASTARRVVSDSIIPPACHSCSESRLGVCRLPLLME